MKHCVTCHWFNPAIIQGPQGQQQKVFLCSNENCTDPVDAEPVTCGIARREPVFCGFNGKYWKEKQAIVVADNNVIQLG